MVSVAESIVAVYAAVVSTLSLIIAVRVYKAGNPDVDVDWEYQEEARKLLLTYLILGGLT